MRGHPMGNERLDLGRKIRREIRIVRRVACLALVLSAALMCLLRSAGALAETDLTGNWGGFDTVDYQDYQLRGSGPDPVDYTGLPINAEARAVALRYSAVEQSLPERQCLSSPPTYNLTSPLNLRIWADYDSITGNLVAWNTSSPNDMAGLKIWMDGRAHPSRYANHTINGFTTGVWKGNILTTYTTHMKRGYLRRNGVPQSDQATMTLHFIKHGNLLTITGEVNDPIYLTKALIYSRVRILDPTATGPAPKNACHPTVEVASYANIGTVPHYLAGSNPAVDELTVRLHIPQIATLGGAETLYPEFRERLQEYTAPAKCERYCCGWEGFGAAANTLPACPTDFAEKRPNVYIPPAFIAP